MSSVLPVITAVLSAAPEIAQAIQKGLENGGYVREGGAILRADGSQKVVTWLRDAVGGPSTNQILGGSLGLIAEYGSALPLANLSISTIGFVAVLQGLETIEQKMDALAREVKEVSWKQDSALYSNFEAALKMAHNAFDAEQENNRHTFAAQAINRFSEVESQYLAQLNRDLETRGGRFAAELFNMLLLAIVSEARCYLELGELETAKRCLEKNVQGLMSAGEKYDRAVIGQDPAIFLHPDLADQISLERITQLWRHREPALTASMVFERLRKRLWKTAGQSPKSWVSNLTPYFRVGEAAEGKKGLLAGLKAQGEEALKLARSAAEAARKGADLPGLGEEQWRGMVPQLAEAFKQVELTYESLGRLRGFQLELEFLVAHDVDFADWRQLTFPVSEPGSYGLILPLDSELLSQ